MEGEIPDTIAQSHQRGTAGSYHRPHPRRARLRRRTDGVLWLFRWAKAACSFSGSPVRHWAPRPPGIPYGGGLVDRPGTIPVDSADVWPTDNPTRTTAYI